MQTIGGAFLVAAGESAFESTLSKQLSVTAPWIDPLQVISTGATDVRKVFSPADVPLILRAYVRGIQTALIVAIAVAGTCTIIAFGAKWQKMQAPPKAEEAKEAEGAEENIESIEAGSDI